MTCQNPPIGRNWTEPWFIDRLLTISRLGTPNKHQAKTKVKVLVETYHKVTDVSAKKALSDEIKRLETRWGTLRDNAVTKKPAPPIKLSSYAPYRKYGDQLLQALRCAATLLQEEPQKASYVITVMLAKSGLVYVNQTTKLENITGWLIRTGVAVRVSHRALDLGPLYELHVDCQLGEAERPAP